MDWEFSLRSISLPLNKKIQNVPLLVYGEGDDAKWMTPDIVRSTIKFTLTSCHLSCRLSASINSHGKLLDVV